MLSNHPKIIALCGHPQHGKSTAQSFLEKELGVRPLDDGRPIRLEGMRRFGLTWHQVSTQEGKIELCFAFGRTMEVREALGLIGKENEEDPAYWAERAIEDLMMGDDTGPVSFGSVRRTQATAYKRCGGKVIEIRDPAKLDSKYDFDQYDRSLVDITVYNDSTLEHFRIKLIDAVYPYLTTKAVANEHA